MLEGSRSKVNPAATDYWRNTSVRMLLPSLRPQDALRLPDGYGFAAYQPGDGVHWVKVVAAAEKYLTINADLFKEQFEFDQTALRERMLFLLAPDRSYAGTATAWADDRTAGAVLGRVHWVAITPEHQGHGLGRPLLAAVLERLRLLGHRRAYLSTSILRIAAINLYLRFGFIPEIGSKQERAAWREAIADLKPEYREIVGLALQS